MITWKKVPGSPCMHILAFQRSLWTRLLEFMSALVWSTDPQYSGSLTEGGSGNETRSAPAGNMVLCSWNAKDRICFDAHCMIVHFSFHCSKTQVMIAMKKMLRRGKRTGTRTIPQKQQHRPLLPNSTQMVQGWRSKHFPPPTVLLLRLPPLSLHTSPAQCQTAPYLATLLQG